MSTKETRPPNVYSAHEVHGAAAKKSYVALICGTNDPQKQGRAACRIVGLQDDESGQSDQNLQWYDFAGSTELDTSMSGLTMGKYVEIESRGNDQDPWITQQVHDNRKGSQDGGQSRPLQSTDTTNEQGFATNQRGPPYGDGTYGHMLPLDQIFEHPVSTTVARQINQEDEWSKLGAQKDYEDGLAKMERPQVYGRMKSKIVA